MDRTDSHTDKPQRRRLGARAGQIAVAAACLAALPATAIAAPPMMHARKPTAKKPAVVFVTDHVRVDNGVLAEGNKVPAFVSLLYSQSNLNRVLAVSRSGSRQTVAAVVRKGVNGRLQKPYRSNGFKCSPIVVTKKAAVFTCEKTVGSAGGVVIDYTVDYR